MPELLVEVFVISELTMMGTFCVLDISTLITATIALMALIDYTITMASISRQQKLMEYSLIAVVVSMRGVLQWQYQVSVTGQYYAFSVSDIDRSQSHDDLAVLAAVVGHHPAIVTTALV